MGAFPSSTCKDRTHAIEQDGREWPRSPEGRYGVQQCSTYYQLGDDSFTLMKPLPEANDGLIFATLGDQVVGSVHFVYDESLHQETQSYIQAINLGKDQLELLAQTKICVLQIGKKQGLGIVVRFLQVLTPFRWATLNT